MCARGKAPGPWGHRGEATAPANWGGVAAGLLWLVGDCAAAAAWMASLLRCCVAWRRSLAAWQRSRSRSRGLCGACAVAA